MGALYLLTFTSGRQYIGITNRTASRRAVLHRHHARKGRKTAVSAAIRKYGYGSFSVRTLVVANDWNYLCDLERLAIAAFGTKAPGGYNLTEGGEGTLGISPSEDARRCRSEQQKGRFLGTRFGAGDRHTDEARRKISEAGRRRVLSPESRAKIEATKVGNKYALGRTYTDEQRKRLSEAIKKGLARKRRRDA